MSVRPKALSWTSLKTISKIAFSNRNTLSRNHTHLLARHRITAAQFSTRSSGLREAVWFTEIDLDVSPWLVNVRDAELAFQKSNPFGDPNAHNCMIDGLPATESIGELKKGHYTAIQRPQGLDLIDTELNKMVESAGYTTQWPVVARPELIGLTLGRSKSLMIHRYKFAFKIPSSEDPEAFLIQLRKAGLAGGTFHVSETKRVTDEWWYKYLFVMPKTEKYWEPPDNAPKIRKHFSRPRKDKR